MAGKQRLRSNERTHGSVRSSMRKQRRRRKTCTHDDDERRRGKHRRENTEYGGGADTGRLARAASVRVGDRCPRVGFALVPAARHTDRSAQPEAVRSTRHQNVTGTTSVVSVRADGVREPKECACGGARGVPTSRTTTTTESHGTARRLVQRTHNTRTYTHIETRRHCPPHQRKPVSGSVSSG